MSEDEKKILVHRLGRYVAAEMKNAGLTDFTGNLSFNLREGKYNNANMVQSFEREKER